MFLNTCDIKISGATTFWTADIVSRDQYETRVLAYKDM